MRPRNRWIGIGLAILGVGLVILLFAAPQSQSQQGSTYSRAPGGYGAWYAYMQQQGFPIQRWQRSVKQLMQPDQPPPAVQQIGLRSEASVQTVPTTPITLLQINSRSVRFKIFDRAWVERGNVLVLVGVQAPVSQAPFRTVLPSPEGTVRIETSRREPSTMVTPRLRDQYGQVVWEKTLGKGRVIYSVTPDLAANAYQSEPGNFKFLANLVTEPGLPVYVDEYLHGYRDQTELDAEGTDTLPAYLARTPLLLLAIQATLILLLLIWGQNQRLGRPQSIAEPALDNSAAYIQALSAVLQKANCSDFVLATLSKAEQLRVQRALGLGSTLLAPEAVIRAWTQQTGQPTTTLEAVICPQSRRFSDLDLRLWLGQLKTLRQQLDSH